MSRQCGSRSRSQWCAVVRHSSPWSASHAPHKVGALGLVQISGLQAGHRPPRAPSMRTAVKRPGEPWFGGTDKGHTHTQSDTVTRVLRVARHWRDTHPYTASHCHRLSHAETGVCFSCAWSALSLLAHQPKGGDNAYLPSWGQPRQSKACTER